MVIAPLLLATRQSPSLPQVYELAGRGVRERCRSTTVCRAGSNRPRELDFSSVDSELAYWVAVRYSNNKDLGQAMTMVKVGLQNTLKTSLREQLLELNKKLLERSLSHP